MNKIIVILLFISFNSFAQRSGNARTIFTNIGIKTSIGTSLITNKDIKTDENVKFNQFGMYYTYGLTAAVSYIGMKPKNMIFSIQAEFLRGQFSHYFSHIETDTKLIYNKNIDYTIDNRILTIRYENAKKKLFVGLGYKHSTFMEVTENNSIINNSFYSKKNNYNLINFYHNYSSMVFDFGINISNLLISLRLTTPVSDINKDNRNPLFDGVYNNTALNSSYSNKYNTTTKTHQFTAQLTLSYRIPFISFGRATSGHDGLSVFKKVDKNYYWNK